jgi:hypothetical protein
MQNLGTVPGSAKFFAKERVNLPESGQSHANEGSEIARRMPLLAAPLVASRKRLAFLNSKT